jgi:hypothetical protein
VERLKEISVVNRFVFLLILSKKQSVIDLIIFCRIFLIFQSTPFPSLSIIFPQSLLQLPLNNQIRPPSDTTSNLQQTSTEEQATSHFIYDSRWHSPALTAPSKHQNYFVFMFISLELLCIRVFSIDIRLLNDWRGWRIVCTNKLRL